ncbi:hypothetical protein [Desulfosporosinus nitroreducens]|uniref:Uncharacterized protein n=1 Tax=Desulfosporosinus nitroreducens TaxID=2018668 RepID=A0ABT8QVN3_9FIRM|nr:hypothetical protein [Desulfosporosinus nitroreducens]MDO0824639.1 hypothetical protein [Desulfosporosinus nitroreducens]
MNTVVSNGNSRNDEFVYNKDSGTMQCPEGHLAMRCEIREGKQKSHSITVIDGVRGKQYEFEQTDYFKQRISIGTKSKLKILNSNNHMD